MEQKPENPNFDWRLDPSIEGFHQHTQNQNEKFVDGEGVLSAFQIAGSGVSKKAKSEKPFKSRFNHFIRSIAIVVILVFVPEQASWAINYNPSVLWPKHFAAPQGMMYNQPQAGVPGTETPGNLTPFASPETFVSAQIAGNIKHLLGQVKGKKDLRLELALDENNEKSVFINLNRNFTNSDISQITNWIARPDVHPLNCGVYALKDILDYHGVETTLEQLSVSTLAVDLLSNIIRPDDPTLKTTLFAINQLTESHELDYRSVKMSSEQIVKLDAPYIANFEGEHFVTVLASDGETIMYNDLGQSVETSVTEFKNMLSGFVLVPSDHLLGFVYEPVSKEAQAFVWGDKWGCGPRRTKKACKENLPGLVSGGEEWGGLAIQVAFAAFGAGSIGQFAFSLGLADFASTVSTICVMKGKCSEKEGFLLNVALIAAGQGIAAGVEQGISNAAIDAFLEGAASEAAKTAAKESAKSAVATALAATATSVISQYAAYEASKAVSDLLGDEDSILSQIVISIAGAYAGQWTVGLVDQAFLTASQGETSLSGMAEVSTVSSPSSDVVNTPNVFQRLTKGFSSRPGFWSNIAKAYSATIGKVLSPVGSFLAKLMGPNKGTAEQQTSGADGIAGEYASTGFFGRTFGKDGATGFFGRMRNMTFALLDVQRGAVVQQLATGGIRLLADKLDIVDEDSLASQALAAGVMQMIAVAYQSSEAALRQAAETKLQNEQLQAERYGTAEPTMTTELLATKDKQELLEYLLDGSDVMERMVIVASQVQTEGANRQEIESEVAEQIGPVVINDTDTAAQDLARNVVSAVAANDETQINDLTKTLTQGRINFYKKNNALQVNRTLLSTLLTVGFASLIDSYEKKNVEGQRDGDLQTDRFSLLAARAISLIGTNLIFSGVAAVTTNNTCVNAEGCSPETAPKGNARNILRELFVEPVRDELVAYGTNVFSLNNTLPQYSEDATLVQQENGSLMYGFTEYVGADGRALNATERAASSIVNRSQYLNEMAKLGGVWTINRTLALERNREEVTANIRAANPELSDDEVQDRYLSIITDQINPLSNSFNYFVDNFNSQVASSFTNINDNVGMDIFNYALTPVFNRFESLGDEYMSMGGQKGQLTYAMIGGEQVLVNGQQGLVDPATFTTQASRVGGREVEGAAIQWFPAFRQTEMPDGTDRETLFVETGKFANDGQNKELANLRIWNSNALSQKELNAAGMTGDARIQGQQMTTDASDQLSFLRNPEMISGREVTGFGNSQELLGGLANGGLASLVLGDNTDQAGLLLKNVGEDGEVVRIVKRERMGDGRDVVAPLDYTQIRNATGQTETLVTGEVIVGQAKEGALNLLGNMTNNFVNLDRKQTARSDGQILLTLFQENDNDVANIAENLYQKGIQQQNGRISLEGLEPQDVRTVMQDVLRSGSGQTNDLIREDNEVMDVVSREWDNFSYNVVSQEYSKAQQAQDQKQFGGLVLTNNPVIFAMNANRSMNEGVEDSSKAPIRTLMGFGAIDNPMQVNAAGTITDMGDAMVAAGMGYGTSLSNTVNMDAKAVQGDNEAYLALALAPNVNNDGASNTAVLYSSYRVGDALRIKQDTPPSKGSEEKTEGITFAKQALVKSMLGYEKGATLDALATLDGKDVFQLVKDQDNEVYVPAFNIRGNAKGSFIDYDPTNGKALLFETFDADGGDTNDQIGTTDELRTKSLLKGGGVDASIMKLVGLRVDTRDAKIVFGNEWGDYNPNQGLVAQNLFVDYADGKIYTTSQDYRLGHSGRVNSTYTTQGFIDEDGDKAFQEVTVSGYDRWSAASVKDEKAQEASRKSGELAEVKAPVYTLTSGGDLYRSGDPEDDSKDIQAVVKTFKGVDGDKKTRSTCEYIFI